jgi:ABC-type sulfate/molybdate transport systems ATPase subunit
VQVTGPNSAEIVLKRGSKELVRFSDVVSADGTTLTSNVTNLVGEQTVTDKLIAKRVGAAPANSHPLSGSWQEQQHVGGNLRTVLAKDGEQQVAFIRPHEIEIGDSNGWSATVMAVRVIGPIVRVELRAEGQPVDQPLEAEISRERYEAERFDAGKKVGLRFRRFHLYPADAARARSTAATA